MELTILNLVLLTFVAGVVGGLVIAEAMDLDAPRRRREKRRAKRRARHHREMKRQAARDQELREMIRRNVNFTIDKF